VGIAKAYLQQQSSDAPQTSEEKPVVFEAKAPKAPWGKKEPATVG
jgi:hypothetical protein